MSSFSAARCSWCRTPWLVACTGACLYGNSAPGVLRMIGLMVAMTRQAVFVCRFNRCLCMPPRKRPIHPSRPAVPSLLSVRLPSPLDSRPSLCSTSISTRVSLPLRQRRAPDALRPSPSQQSTRQAPSPPPSAPTPRLARGSQFARPQPFTTSQPTRDLSGAATLQLHHDIRLLASNV